ncbi:MAG: signal peptidase I [Acidimicrobiales bacterium]
MKDRRRTAVRIAKAAVWWVLAALILAIIGGYFGSSLIRGVYPPYVAVEGISMEPMLHVGDVVVLEHATVHKLVKGDIIAFQTTKTVQEKYDVPSHFVHKIYKVIHEPHGQVEFETKGIHNAAPDGFFTPSSMVIGEYDGYIPYAGYVVLFVQSTEGLVLGGAVALVIAIYILLGHLEERKAEREQITVDFAQALHEMRSMVEDVTDAVTSRANARAGPTESPGSLPELVAAPPAPPAPPTPAAEKAESQQPAVAGAPLTASPLDERVEALVGAVSEYGVHLRSHTAVMQHLAATTDKLELATEGLLRVVSKENERDDGAAPEGGEKLASIDELLYRSVQKLNALIQRRARLDEDTVRHEAEPGSGSDAAAILATPAQEPATPQTTRSVGTRASIPPVDPAPPPIWEVQPLPTR